MTYSAPDHTAASRSVPTASFPAPGTPQVHAHWPNELLNAFILRMAANGFCVSAAMMLGHRAYAMEQVVLAHVSPDPSLHALAQRLLAHFDR